MSCIPCVAEGEGSSIPLEDFDRWTDSLRQVLESRDGRRYFREFLASRGLEESEAALEFWERCEVLLRSSSENSRSHPKSAGENSSSSSSSHPKLLHAKHGKQASIENLRFMKDARDLVRLAEDRVNLDLAQMRCLYEAVDSGKEEHVQTVFRQAMQTAVELLHDDYQLFRRHLLRERGLLSTKNN